MSAGELFIYMLLLFAACSIAIYIRMIIFLQHSGEKISLFSFRLMLPYLSRYREVLAREKPGGMNLFYLWLVSINAALVCAIILFLVS